MDGELRIMVLACQVDPFHLKLTQINSERNCIAKHKSPDSQKLDTRRRGENFKACQEQRHVYLIFVQEKIQKILLSFWNTVLFSRTFVLLMERDRLVIRLDKIQ